MRKVIENGIERLMTPEEELYYNEVFPIEQEPIQEESSADDQIKDLNEKIAHLEGQLNALLAIALRGE